MSDHHSNPSSSRFSKTDFNFADDENISANEKFEIAKKEAATFNDLIPDTSQLRDILKISINEGIDEELHRSTDRLNESRPSYYKPPIFSPDIAIHKRILVETVERFENRKLPIDTPERGYRLMAAVIGREVFMRNISSVIALSLGLMYDIEYKDLARLTLMLNGKDATNPDCIAEIGNVRKRVQRATELIIRVFGHSITTRVDPADRRRKIFTPHPDGYQVQAKIEQYIGETALPDFIVQACQSETVSTSSISNFSNFDHRLYQALRITHPKWKKEMLESLGMEEFPSPNVPLIYCINPEKTYQKTSASKGGSL